MRTFSQASFFKELNLEGLSSEKKEKIWQKFLELVSLEVLDKILDDLPKKEQEKLFVDLAEDPKKITKFLQMGKDFSKITKVAVLKIKKEVLG